MSGDGITVTGLSKVFGPDPPSVMDRVRGGIGKAELLAETGHVLGLRGIEMEVAPHAIHVVMGLSGSGKSTLLRHVNRLIDPTEGRVVVNGREVTAMNAQQLTDFRRHAVGMVFQRFALLPHRTVAENVGYGLAVQGVERRERARRTADWIERVGLTGCESFYPAQLSGGMQQRVGLARALATNAGVLLMDEAFSALDPLIRAEMQDMLLGLQADLRKTILFVTHDLEEALKLGDSITILRDGEIVQDGDPQAIVTRPADGYVAQFVKDINRARVVKVASIMTPPGGGGAANGLQVSGDTVLEDAAAALARAGAARAVVTTAGGEVVGQVTLTQILDAATRPAEASAISDRTDPPGSTRSDQIALNHGVQRGNIRPD